MILSLEETFIVGQDVAFDSLSPTNSFAVTFEDNMKTGYYYAMVIKPELQVLDALHIYNVANVIDRHKPSKVQIGWSDDGLLALLIINGYCHAFFDFEKRAGYCRTGYPDNKSGWTSVDDRTLTDELLKSIIAQR